MAISHSPGLVVQKSGRSVGTQLRRVFLIQDGTDPNTGDPVIVLDGTGPATHVFTYNSGAGEILVDDSIASPTYSAVNCVLNESSESVFYE